ncbi:hypothetical protein O6H91_10G004500 [Diphasiastrum complanatum]|uniref:Uncharacterized protein n=1 Tax=Diphasiastrum complanatum TaxID=34168 RepID=A0ACC2CDV9_DIPCM|nr:hypothetical protein O6H91_10G004500 [Diphasiastrum complanatum]
MDMDRQIRVAYTSRKVLILALVCTICLILTAVSVALNQFSVDRNIYYTYLRKQKSKRFHIPNDRLSSVDRSSVVQIKGQPPLLTSFRPANLSSVHQDPLITAELPPAPVLAPISIDSHECKRACGKVAIPYPFGLSPECARSSQYELNCTCARSSQYELNCTDSNNSLAQENLEDPSGPWPFLSTPSGPFQVINISSNYLSINTTKIKAMAKTPAENGDCSGLANASLELDPYGPYIISSQNIFLVTGCGSIGAYSMEGPLESLYSGDGICGPPCINQFDLHYCNDYSCCIVIMKASRQIYMQGRGINFTGQDNVCGFSSILDTTTYHTWNPGGVGIGQYGVRLVWAILDYPNCTVAKSQPDYACFDKGPLSSCNESGDISGYFCECTATGYEGDGYKNGTGCADVNECANPSLNNCAENATCANLHGTYNCSCEKGLIGDGYRNGTNCTRPSESNPPVALISGIASGIGIFITINVVIVWCLWRRWKNRLGGSCENLQLSTINFHETLMELQKRDGANVCKIFSLEELKKATNNFSQDHELGSGGFGTVFQGVLEDYMRVAIKRPKNEVGESQNDIKQFINEVTILSQVNHRNLVKLLGCCLETRVPLLVYEYVLNGNLLEHLQGQKRIECKSSLVLDWDKRLDIAIGIAEALRYLHFGTSPPIYHRDVKCSNILLDDKYQAKVADFGISRLIPIESTHFSTMIQGAA